MGRWNLHSSFAWHHLIPKISFLKVTPSPSLSDQLVASATVIIIGVNTKGYITLFNDSAELYTGYQRTEVLGHPFSLLLSAKAAEQVKAMLTDFQSNQAIPANADYSILNKAGIERLITWHHSIVKDPLSIIFIGTDAREQRKTEAIIADTDKSKSQSNFVRHKILSSASHDLNQPIHALGLFLSMLEQNTSAENQSEIISNARTALKSYKVMMQAIIEFARINLGMINPQLQPVRMQLLLNKLEREFAAEANAKNLSYRSRETEIIVYSDPLLVEIILRKLISNAIQFTHHGGLLVSARKAGDNAIIEVWDTGVGIEPSRHQTLLQEYTLPNHLQRKVPQGLGLGLAIADELTHSLGHQLSLSSIPQRGSVFRLTLPLSETKLLGEMFASTPFIDPLNNMRVLLIEDDIRMRNYLQELFNHLGYICDAAASLEEALAYTKLHQPNFVISDYLLNDQLNGIDAIAHIRAISGSSLPAMLITGHTSLDLIHETIACNIHLLHKPFTTEELSLGLIKILKQ
jgi:PAS domain S-box-containing protein